MIPIRSEAIAAEVSESMISVVEPVSTTTNKGILFILAKSTTILAHIWKIRLDRHASKE